MQNTEKLSQNTKLDKLLKTVIKEVRRYAEDQITHIQRLVQIGLALSGTKDINKLLEMIVSEARDLSNADAGTLYILDKDNNLRFEILQNDSMKTRMVRSDTPDSTLSLPNVPL
ncbi:hypothetical protein GMMP15_1110020 [Candidatus Magnetomoraceae bacterium gMMP-15]